MEKQTQTSAQTASASESKPSVTKKKRARSPSYPAISLEEAIGRATTVWKHERKNVAPLDAVMHHWGYKSKSSSGLLAAAAMKKYGLLVEVEGTNGRNVRLSELAINIILDGREDSTERAAQIKDAALKPSLHRELWEKWGPEMPSDATMRTYLLRDRDFTESAATQALDVYRNTISFAKLRAGDIISNVSGDDDEQLQEESDGRADARETGNTPGTGTKLPVGRTPPVPPGQKDFPSYLTNNQRAILFVPAVMTKKDFDLLKRQIENHLMVIEATSVNDDSVQ